MLREAYSNTLSKALKMVRYKTKVEIIAHKVLVPQRDGKLTLDIFFTVDLDDLTTLKAKTSDILKI